MKYIVLLFAILFFQSNKAQEKHIEQFPVFPDCEGKYDEELEKCFYYKVEKDIFENFKVPEELASSNYQGVFSAIVEINNQGKFNLLYDDATHSELKNEIDRVVKNMPTITPPTYGGRPTYARYTIRVTIPLINPDERISKENQNEQSITETKDSANSFGQVIAQNKSNELEQINQSYSDFHNPQFKSYLNIPFSHSLYAQFDAAMNVVGTNNHTASKPFTYAQVARYHDFEKKLQEIKKNKTSWWGRKLWNEHTVEIQGENYWFTINPFVDLRLGKNTPGDVKYTYQNTRGIQAQGGLRKNLFFTTSIYESQGRFADYFNQYAESIRPTGGNPAVIPGIGIAKNFKTDSYDFPLAEANITFVPSDFIDLQLGYGRNFIGDGYRSLLMGDGASPYPFFKINTQFWKIKYTNTYTWLKDIRTETEDERSYATKYMASHYLSWNVTDYWNLGLFESVVWANTNNRGFDLNFVNPIIFYRAVEFASSSRSGNAVIGLTSKVKLNNSFNFYGQFILDEFSLGEIKDRNKSWKNKYGYQIGAKYYNAFKIDNLLFQLEYNRIRPYVYSHSDPLTNYGHNNQSLGHQWGANFQEFIAIARYFNGRWFADAKITFGSRGLDFDTEENGNNYGSNIYKNYTENRPYNNGVVVGQGNKTNVFIADLQAGYLINPTSNLKLFGSIIYRNFDPTQDTTTASKNDTTWFSVGLRADLFNWYFDF